MNISFARYFQDETKRAAETCIACGVCARECPIVEKVFPPDRNPKDIQKEMREFLRTGTPNATVFTRAFSCMECYKCLESCPQGLNPLLINEIVKSEYRRSGECAPPYADNRDPNVSQRILASIQVSRTDYQKIFTPSKETKARYVFFPGCNVYSQPEKVLLAREVLAHITDDIAFVPGLDYCCGDIHLGFGDPEKAGETNDRFIEKISAYSPDLVILWCATCQCRFEKSFSRTRKIPFPHVSLSRFLGEHGQNLRFTQAIDRTVTIHEPCKAAYTGLDPHGPRTILSRIDGLVIKEMPRHGANTACCGSGAVTHFPEALAAVLNERMKEAADTGADTLVDVCHFCHQLFVGQEEHYEYQAINFISLVAEALGIHREDTFRKYMHLGDLEAILKEAGPFIQDSDYSEDQIIQVIKNTFVRER